MKLSKEDFGPELERHQETYSSLLHGTLTKPTFSNSSNTISKSSNKSGNNRFKLTANSKGLDLIQVLGSHKTSKPQTEVLKSKVIASNPSSDPVDTVDTFLYGPGNKYQGKIPCEGCLPLDVKHMEQALDSAHNDFHESVHNYKPAKRIKSSRRGYQGRSSISNKVINVEPGLVI